MNNKISCIICTYNRSQLLKDAIESILQQDYPHWELIVVDDKSPDDTETVMEEYLQKDDRIRYVKNPKKGLTSARNCGISHATGDYIAFLDDDDISLPHRFSSQLRAMQQSGCRFLVSGYQVKRRGVSEVLHEKRLELKAKGAGFTQRWLVTKELLTEIGGFDEEMTTMEDVECSYSLALREDFTLHDEVVTVQYETPRSMSRSSAAHNLQGRLNILQRHENHLPPIEAAWWYYSAGFDSFVIGNDREAQEYFRKAAGLDTRMVYKLAYQYFRLFHPIKGPFQRIHKKVLNFLRRYRFPTLIDHPVVKVAPMAKESNLKTSKIIP